MKTIWTVGHSNRTLEEFLEIVKEIELLADVRRFPISNRFPHFNRESLEKAKGYQWFEALGGRRGGEGERHTSLKSPQFKAYAGYMETPEFLASFEQLEKAASEKRTAILCAEAAFFRCHRQLLADLLTARGWTVTHLPTGKIHLLNPIARVEDGKLVYDQPAPPKTEKEQEEPTNQAG